jgi:hypothetical protein
LIYDVEGRINWAVVLEHAAAEGHPPALRCVVALVEQGLGAPDPSVHDGWVTEDAAVDERELSRHSDRADVVAVGSIRGVGPFQGLGAGGEVELEVRGGSHGFQGRAR